jgi:hypothetical protein
MVMVPIRVVERRDDGVECRLGSSPGADAPVRFLPAVCILKIVVAEGSDLGVVVLDPERMPEDIRAALGC